MYQLKVYNDLDADENDNGRKLVKTLQFETEEEAVAEAESGKYDGEWTSVEIEKI